MTSLCKELNMSGKASKRKIKRKNSSLRLEESTLKKLKIHAVKKDTSIQKIIEELVEKFLKIRK